jgi:hypothetical protein
MDLGWFGVLSNERTKKTKLFLDTNALTAGTNHFQINLGIGY